MSSSYFASNLKFLRTKKGLKQVQIPNFIGFSVTAWNNYENGTSKPKFDDLVSISKFFEISETELIHSDLSKGNLLNNNGDSETTKKGNLNSNLKGNLITLKEDFVQYGGNIDQHKPNVYDISTTAAAGLANLVQDIDKKHLKPSLSLPHLGSGNHFRIKVSGDSMHSTVKDGDYLIATYQPEPLKSLREGYIYVIIDKEDGIVCKRVYKAGAHHLEFESDNSIYKPYKRHLNDIIAMFKVIEVHTTDLRNYYNDLRVDIRKLWNKIDDIESKLQ